MALNFLGYSSFFGLGNVNDRQIRKRKQGAGSICYSQGSRKTPNKKQASFSIDIKGVLALSVTISSFVIALTLIQIGINSENLLQIAGAFVISAVSLSIFVIVERRAEPPFFDLRLLRHKILLRSYIILIATGITMFMIYPSIVQLVRSPIPLGFGGNSEDAETFSCHS